MRICKKDTLRALKSGRVLMVTFGAEKTFALDNGVGVSLRTGLDLTGQGELSFPADVIPNDDGLFPGFSQTWQARQ